MRTALSIADAVTKQQCEYRGCRSCVYRVMPYSTYGCISEKSGSRLRDAPSLARMLGADPRELHRLLNDELEDVEGERLDYQRMRPDQARTLVSMLDGLLEASQVAIVDGMFLRPEYVADARRFVGWWVEELRHPDGAIRPAISRLISSLHVARRFLEEAADKQFAVEVGRYRFGLLSREPL